MATVFDFNTIDDYNRFNQQETLHPLVSVINFSKANPRRGSKMTFAFYCVFLKDVKCGDLKYGRNAYDYQEGTLVFISPGQSIDVENKTDTYQPQGHGLVFHPDIIRGTSLGKLISDYHFFDYQTNEALHLSAKERHLVLELFAKIETELHHAVDKHSKRVITSNIELFLNYSDRFYDRQFITREVSNSGRLERFEALLKNYFSSDKPSLIGLPNVAYFASQLNLSPNYLGDLIKRDSGQTAHVFIQQKIIETAKEKIFDQSKSISEISYELGFKYPQHFTRLFKQQVGFTPLQFRIENAN